MTKDKLIRYFDLLTGQRKLLCGRFKVTPCALSKTESSYQMSAVGAGEASSVEQRKKLGLL